MLNSSSNILMLIVTKQIEKLSEELREQLKENILNWGRLKASMASLCSGSNVACLAAKTLHIAVVGNATSCTKLFDVEVDPEKQKWLNMLFDGSHTCIFNKMEDMGSSKAYCCVHKKECEVPTGPDGPFLVPCGVSCKDVSKANPKNKEFRSGLQERKGVTANSLWGFWHYCELHQPPVLILENVENLLNATANNFDELKRRFGAIGYAVKHVVLDASLWVPQIRKRVYIIALNMRLFDLDEDGARALLGKMVSTIQSLSFEAPLSLESFIKEKDHARVKAEKKELQKLAAKRRVGGSEKEVEWPEKQLEEMSTKGITYISLRKFKEQHEANPWFSSLGRREQLLLLHTLAVKMEAKTIDIGQSIWRATASTSVPCEGGAIDLVSTLTCHSAIWLCKKKRMLTGWEACLLQAIPVDAIPGAMAMPRRSLVALAGDAFCGAAFSACLIGIMAHMIPLSHAPEDYVTDDSKFLDDLVWVEE